MTCCHEFVASIKIFVARRTFIMLSKQQLAKNVDFQYQNFVASNKFTSNKIFSLLKFQQIFLTIKTNLTFVYQQHKKMLIFYTNFQHQQVLLTK